MSPLQTSLIALPLLLAGCQRSPSAGDRADAPQPSATATATAAPAPPVALVDLLYRTRSSVAVSSNVANPKDYPEHLIDRRPETAWNGKTGDLDARVLFRVPASARVRRILLTVGYDKTTKDGDLFFMNHRLKRVTLSRAGRLVGTFDLDPENRKPQPIEIDEPGGDFELRAIETVPGSKASWREIVISELSVLGTAPDEELLAPAMPQVTIGSLDRPKSETGPLTTVHAAAPFKSFEAFCAAHLAVEAKVLERIKARDRSDFTNELTPHCGRLGRRAVKQQRLAAPFEKIEIASLLEGEQWVDRLLIQTNRGVYPTPITFAMEYPGPGCGLSSGYEIDSATVETKKPNVPIVVLRVTKSAAYLMATPDSFEAAAEFFIACTLDAAGAPVCREELVASFDGDGSWTRRRQEARAYDVHPARWDWKREASVDDEGHIRLSPCVDAKGLAAVCGRRNADLLRRH